MGTVTEKTTGIDISFMEKLWFRFPFGVFLLNDNFQELFREYKPKKKKRLWKYFCSVWNTHIYDYKMLAFLFDTMPKKLSPWKDAVLQ